MSNVRILPTFQELDMARSSAESAFRRGYHHGYSQAMDDLQTGCDASRWRAVARWFDRVMLSWRNNWRTDTSSPPNFPATAPANPE